MSNLCDSSFFDSDYYENGVESKKSCLVDYKWMPRRSFKEAFGFIDYFELDENSYVIDFGCAKGFIVRALNELDIKTDGCDISDYALSFTSPDKCWNCNTSDWADYKNKYTHIVCKDVLEHISEIQLNETLQKLKILAKKFMVVVPLGDSGVYRIPEYHFDPSHVIAEDENWWANKFKENGWDVEKSSYHVNGIKDNWLSYANGKGNIVFNLYTK